MRNERDHVDAHASLTQLLEVLRERRDFTDLGQRIATTQWHVLLGQVALAPEWRHAETAVARHYRRDALCDRAVGAPIHQERHVRVRVDVDESGGQDEVRPVDDLRPMESVGLRHSLDLVGRYCYVSGPRRRTRAVHQHDVLNDKVIPPRHSLVPPGLMGRARSMSLGVEG